ncbi:arginine--tRNA ligase [Thalassospira xiamenensis]|uniref:Arginine--tRNA ligase n=1 Tax=Thalassospira xiamenensis TaxID=220697 RepID=A0A285TXP2_9PROT|nr:arginine--tRNA ligase [Thalassospira xiamenensis]SOC30570.1 arginyl-tRNA synthetase [Thalassospira xiamenensis]
MHKHNSSLTSDVAAYLAEELGVEISVSTMACPLPEQGDVALNVAFAAAKALRTTPMRIAEKIASHLNAFDYVAVATACYPGFVNVLFSDEALKLALGAVQSDPNHGIAQADSPETIILDFGGPNIKPMHVGHMRSLFLGEALRRILISLGHRVTSDIHFGDWGMPSGIILEELKHRMPDLPWFDRTKSDYPETPPISPSEIADLYPAGSAACKEDLARKMRARETTVRLQEGDPALTDLWQKVSGACKKDILQVCGQLGAHFDLTLGESDAHKDIPEVLRLFADVGASTEEEGNTIVDVRLPEDKYDVPPVFLSKEDGSTLYATTDIATVLARVRDFTPDRILYVVDERQSLHFLQIKRAVGMIPAWSNLAIEHVGFGTVNGSDGRPFKTRDGNVMSLTSLIDIVTATASERLGDAIPDDAEELSSMIAVAALRIADLSTHRQSGYSLDVDKAVSFEGRTGPYLLYSVVRMRKLLDQQTDADVSAICFDVPIMRELCNHILNFGSAVHSSAAASAPHLLVNWSFECAAALNRFYATCPVSTETDTRLKSSRIALASVAVQTLEHALVLLGCQIPKKM